MRLRERRHRSREPPASLPGKAVSRQNLSRSARYSAAAAGLCKSKNIFRKRVIGHRRSSLCPKFFAMTSIEVNGARHDVAASPDTPLLYVLRNHLGLMGTRFGCGSGQRRVSCSSTAAPWRRATCRSLAVERK